MAVGRFSFLPALRVLNCFASCWPEAALSPLLYGLLHVAVHISLAFSRPSRKRVSSEGYVVRKCNHAHLVTFAVCNWFKSHPQLLPALQKKTLHKGLTTGPPRSLLAKPPDLKGEAIGPEEWLGL